jgi:hypothetical protein
LPWLGAHRARSWSRTAARLSGRSACDPLFTPRPLGPIHDLARSLGGPLLDALGTESNRNAVFSALLGELESMPTLAVLEDVHWADEATLDALRSVVRRIDQAPVSSS